MVVDGSVHGPVFAPPPCLIPLLRPSVRYEPYGSQDAQVACKQLGMPWAGATYVTNSSRFGQNPNMYPMSTVCFSNAKTSLFLCQYAAITCTTFNTVGGCRLD